MHQRSSNLTVMSKTVLELRICSTQSWKLLPMSTYGPTYEWLAYSADVSSGWQHMCVWHRCRLVGAARSRQGRPGPPRRGVHGKSVVEAGGGVGLEHFYSRSQSGSQIASDRAFEACCCFLLRLWCVAA
jgi:hypothetical protein